MAAFRAQAWPVTLTSSSIMKQEHAYRFDLSCISQEEVTTFDGALRDLQLRVNVL
jgi:hypothetical protein